MDTTNSSAASALFGAFGASAPAPSFAACQVPNAGGIDVESCKRTGSIGVEAPFLGRAAGLRDLLRKMRTPVQLSR